MTRKDSRRIVIDVADWVDEFFREEPDLKSEEDVVICVVERGYSTGQVARMVTAARALGIAPQDILKSSKLHLYAGARQDVGQRVARRKCTVELPNGKEIEVRAFVGIPGRPKDWNGGDDDEDTEFALEIPDTEIIGKSPFVDVDSTEGLERAIHYLLNVLPGHAFERLKIIAVAGGDVVEAGEDLKGKIDGLVERLI